MKFSGFDWDDGNRDKCRKHGMTIIEIESLFAEVIVLLPDKLNSREESRFRAIGTTVTRRKAFIVFTWRGDLIRPISARYMHKEEVALYEKSYPDI